MAITVDLYSFAKKINSTAVPATAPLSFSCTLKDECSILYPIIGINNGAAWDPASYNYAAITAFQRFYYISDWSYYGGLWWASLTFDALATWKTRIYNATEYVLRAAHTFDGTIIDTLYPAKSTYTENITRWNNNSGGPYTPWINSITSGFYVVGIINTDSNSMGAVSYYAFTPAQFANLKTYLMGDVTWTGILTTNPDIGENLFKALFNPFQYISSVNWFPFSIPTGIMTSISTIKFGWWEISNISCYRLNAFFHTLVNSIPVIAHPQSSARGVYLNGSPYSRYILKAPPFGTFELDASLFPSATYSNGSTSVTCAITVDLISGYGGLNVYIDQTNLMRYQTMIAVPINIAQISSENNVGTLVNTVEQGISSLVQKLLGSGDGNRITDIGIADAAAIGSVTMMQTGSNGTISTYNQPFIIQALYSVMADDANTDKGRPLCKEIQLGDLAPGYIITANSHIAIPGCEAEITAVNTALDNGVFLE